MFTGLFVVDSGSFLITTDRESSELLLSTEGRGDGASKINFFGIMLVATLPYRRNIATKVGRFSLRSYVKCVYLLVVGIDLDQVEGTLVLERLLRLSAASLFQRRRRRERLDDRVVQNVQSRTGLSREGVDAHGVKPDGRGRVALGQDGYVVCTGWGADDGRHSDLSVHRVVICYSWRWNRPTVMIKASYIYPISFM